MFDFALVHWPFAVAFGGFWVLGVSLKQGPLSRQRAREVAWVRFLRRWFPLPLLMMAMGACLGAWPMVPMPVDAEGADAVPRAYAWLYYTGAAVASILRHTIWREFRRYKGEDPGGIDKNESLLADVRSTKPPPTPPGA